MKRVSILIKTIVAGSAVFMVFSGCAPAQMEALPPTVCYPETPQNTSVSDQGLVFSTSLDDHSQPVNIGVVFPATSMRIFCTLALCGFRWKWPLISDEVGQCHGRNWPEFRSSATPGFVV